MYYVIKSQSKKKKKPYESHVQQFKLSPFLMGRLCISIENIHYISINNQFSNPINEINYDTINHKLKSIKFKSGIRLCLIFTSSCFSLDEAI